MLSSTEIRICCVASALATLLMSCGPKEPHRNMQEDFSEFYQRFHADSAFQMSRIAFPLSGIPAKDTVESFVWTADSWKLHRPFDNSTGEFDREIRMITEDIAIETISVRGLDIAMQRRFARLADGWNLIYYVEMQPVE